jgi:hypothetical protein
MNEWGVKLLRVPFALSKNRGRLAYLAGHGGDQRKIGDPIPDCLAVPIAGADLVMSNNSIDRGTSGAHAPEHGSSAAPPHR